MGKTQRILGGVLILLALALAAYAWVLSERMTAEQHEAETRLQPVVVATVRIAAGTTILPEMVQLTGLPSRPPGSYGDIKAVLGKLTASDIAVGEPLLQERIEGNVRAMQQRLEEGERAVAVRVDDVIAVGNRLNPGDRVDVFVTLRRNSEEIPDTQSRLLLEKLRVLAFGSKDAAATKDSGSQLRSNTETPKTAVLAVRLGDVDKLALAAESGRLLLALRPQEAVPDKAPEGVAVTSASPAQISAAAKEVAPPVLTLRDLVGTGKIGQRGLGVGPNSPAGKGVAASGSAVSVLHGLKEKTVYLNAKQSEARQ
ncbi:Flp pilus assembly protein CpaB [Quatrionicoccus australiensis]|uniref:Flp pilus assembly protein CpaB n=1 Tax=Quatrionicoccus australiensis TaxID=138118 RepID=UPI001CF9993D|nr:Flp pilus assembly protein CpaB [Quatrionicoccus australiensis]MCB4360482.1 Flp pilus assembly protein CpaB [Quatrionicoccus australiensis]